MSRESSKIITLPSMETIDFLKYWRVLMEYKWFIVIIPSVFAVISWFVAGQFSPVYKASTLVRIEGQQVNALPLNELMILNSGREQELLTEFEILKSLGIVEQVVERLSLHEIKEFDPRKDESLVFDEDELISEVVTSVSENLSVTPIRNTQLVSVSFESIDPNLAAKVANTIVDTYIENHLLDKLGVADNATNSLKSKLVELKDSLKNAELDLQEYREKADLVDISGITTLDSNELTILTNRYVEVRNQRYEAEIIYKQVKSLAGNHSISKLMGIPSVLSSSAVQRLEASRVDAEHKVFELSKLFGEKHPEMIAARTEVESSEAALRKQIQTVFDSLKASYYLALKNEKSLERQISKVRKRFQELNRKEFKLKALESEVDVNKKLYNAFSARIKEVNQTLDLYSAHAKVIDIARVPREPFKPRKVIISLVMFVVSGFFVILAILIKSSLTRLFYNPVDVEENLGLPFLGKVPLVANLNNKERYGCLLKGENTNFIDSMLTVRSSIMMTALNKENKLLLVTSSIPDEGKSTIASNLAAAFSKLEKTLLIDMDLRRASLSKALTGDSVNYGVTDLLANKKGLKDIVKPLSDSVDFISAGSILSDALTFISSDKMEVFLEALKKHYSHIVIDTPPVHAASDAVVLSRMVDSVVYVVKYDSTNQKVVNAGLKKIHDIDSNVSGVVLSCVDPDKEKYHGDYRTIYGYS